MFDSVDARRPVEDPGRIDARAFTNWRQQLTAVAREVSDTERIDQIRALEELKAAAAAAQARITADLDTTTRAAHAAAGVPAERQGRGVAAQVALARRESPHRGNQHLGLAKILTTEMPHTLTALERGVLSEWRATLLVRETACLDREHRIEVDRRLAADPAQLERWGDRQLIAEIQKLAYALDAAAVTRRRAKAESERRVSCRPAPDTMAIVSALLPVAQGVAVYAALGRAADTLTAAGDDRSRGQIMADTLVERVTGQAIAPAVPVEIHLVMTDDTLFDEDCEPAHLFGFGPVPADLARRLAVFAAEAETAWLRRLYTEPTTGDLVGMDSRRRLFPAGLARFIRVRDQICRTPWCDAPIRHIDHIQPHHEDGPTSASNGEGLCEQCNYNAQTLHHRARAGPGHLVEIITPTGHVYPSTAPRPPGSGPPTLPVRVDFAFPAHRIGPGLAA